MKVHVDANRCQGHTLCSMIAPDIFELDDDDGHAFVREETVAPSSEDVVRKAAGNCPEMAIVVTES